MWGWTSGSTTALSSSRTWTASGATNTPTIREKNSLISVRDVSQCVFREDYFQKNSWAFVSLSSDADARQRYNSFEEEKLWYTFLVMRKSLLLCQRCELKGTRYEEKNFSKFSKLLVFSSVEKKPLLNCVGVSLLLTRTALHTNYEFFLMASATAGEKVKFATKNIGKSAKEEEK